MASTTLIGERTEQDLDELLRPLQALAGEIRLLIHWANDECRRTWDVLEPRLFDLEIWVETVSDDDVAELRRLGHDLHGRLQALREAVRRA